MSKDIGKDIPKGLPHVRDLDQKIDAGRVLRTAAEGVLPRERLDRYSTPKLVLDVLRHLKAALSLKVDPRTELAEKKELSLFEKVFLARFDGKLEIGEKLEQGTFKFLGKTEKAWAEFFQKFLPFTLQKKGKVTELEGLVFRGLLKPAGEKKDGEKGMVVSDLLFVNGKSDKFARLEIQSRPLLEKLASLMPGDLLAQAIVAEWIGGPEFAYLALSHKIVQPEVEKGTQNPLVESYRTPEQMKEAAIREGVREISQGIALSARTEQLIAERLDIDLKPPRGEGALDLRTREVEQRGESGIRFGAIFFGKKRKKGLFGGMFEEGAGSTEPVFVPWYQQIFRPRKLSGKPKWYVPLIYFVSASAAVLFTFYVFRFLLQR